MNNQNDNQNKQNKKKRRRWILGWIAFGLVALVMFSLGRSMGSSNDTASDDSEPDTSESSSNSNNSSSDDSTDKPSFSNLSEDEIGGHTLKVKFLDRDSGYKIKTQYFNFYKDGHLVITTKPDEGDLDEINLQSAYDKTDSTILKSIDYNYAIKFYEEKYNEHTDKDTIQFDMEDRGIYKDPDPYTSIADKQACDWHTGDDNIMMRFGTDENDTGVNSMKFDNFKKDGDDTWTAKYHCPDWTDKDEAYTYHVELEWE